ncbi:MAG TPA: alpha/beta fold hydrolase [Solirubrobacterales bacterium]
MLLHTRQWGPGTAQPVVCVHGLTQHGGIFETLAVELGADYRVVSVDLRGHGASGREPPWNTETHVNDLLETVDSLGIPSATWIGHSFGGRLIAALAAVAPERVEAMALLDPGFSVPPAHALKSAEMDRLDWSFASVDGAVNALLSADTVVTTPREAIAAYAAGDLRRGSDGRLRFSFSPAAAVVAWNEVTLPSPPIAPVPTLLVRPVTSAIHSRADDRRYRDALGSRLTMAAVPHGHNVLWESPAETAAAIAGFLISVRPSSRPG